MARRVFLLFAAPLLFSCFAEIDSSLIDDASLGNNDGAVNRDAGVRDSGAGCPQDMVRINASDDFCIDRTEVTNEAYARFVSGAVAGNQQQPCRWNTSFLPDNGWPAALGDEERPVASIDWCDALAYCTSVGKRLCGEIGGGASSLANAADDGDNEWPYACSRDGDRAYPYSEDFQAGRCNGENVRGSTADVKSFSECTGGYDGLNDLSGNVEEWQDACLRASGAGDLCAALGGGFAAAQTGLRCRSLTTVSRAETSPERGVRCCRDP